MSAHPSRASDSKSAQRTVVISKFCKRCHHKKQMHDEYKVAVLISPQDDSFHTHSKGGVVKPSIHHPTDRLELDRVNSHNLGLSV
eukprot:10270772-Ditylum_brightwellii.AAC.1